MTTASQRGAANRRKGAVFERAVANAIRPWFPDVRRSRDNGSAHTSDTGDLADAGPFWWSCKDDKAGDLGTPSVLAAWQNEAAVKAGKRLIPVIVQKRRGHADPLRSWCWMRLPDLFHVATFIPVPAAPAGPWARLELAAVLRLFVDTNYAIEPNREAAS